MSRYGQYGETAIMATECIRQTGACPKLAWGLAAREKCGTANSAAKGCPRSTYLALCQNGWVNGVPKGNYVARRENARYAVCAVRLLLAEDDSTSTRNPTVLWDKIQEIENREISYDSQMHVVLALWNAGMIAI